MARKTPQVSRRSSGPLVSKCVPKPEPPHRVGAGYTGGRSSAPWVGENAPHDRIVWNGEMLVWATERPPDLDSLVDDDGLMPEFRFPGRAS